METPNGNSVMYELHELATAEWGRMAAPLDAERGVQALHFPGGSYAVLVRPVGAGTMEVCQAVGRPDLAKPGLSELLLREHRGWCFGRLELVDELLVVSHSFLREELSATTLPRFVLAVHGAACTTEALLTSVDALGVADDDVDEAA